MQQQDCGRSKLREADAILRGLVDQHNTRVELPGLKLGDVPSAVKKAPQPEPERRVPWTFHDAQGKPWNVELPAKRDGSILDQASSLVAKDVKEKVSFKPDTRRGTDQAPRGA